MTIKKITAIRYVTSNELARAISNALDIDLNWAQRLTITLDAGELPTVEVKGILDTDNLKGEKLTKYLLTYMQENYTAIEMLADDPEIVIADDHPSRSPDRINTLLRDLIVDPMGDLRLDRFIGRADGSRSCNVAIAASNDKLPGADRLLSHENYIETSSDDYDRIKAELIRLKMEPTQLKIDSYPEHLFGITGLSIVPGFRTLTISIELTA